MAYDTNSFCWHTLFVKKRDAAKAFYSEVIGWKTQPFAMPDGEYTLFLTGEHGRGGISPVDVPAPPHWAAYLRVDDVDATAAKIEANGGQVLMPPKDIAPGRFAPVADPTGAAFLLFKEADPAASNHPPNGHGAFHWTELWSTDVDKALTFYKTVFGFETESMDMPDGTYYVLNSGGKPRGGLMASKAEGAPAMWVSWVEVDDVDATLTRTTQHGGTVQVPAFDVPNIGRMGIIVDAAGAMIGVITPAQQG